MSLYILSAVPVFATAFIALGLSCVVFVFALISICAAAFGYDCCDAEMICSIGTIVLASIGIIIALCLTFALLTVIFAVFFIEIVTFPFLVMFIDFLPPQNFLANILGIILSEKD